MTTVKADALHAAEHFMSRSARLLDRHRFAYLFTGGPAEPVRTVLDGYRNIDGGYGNGLYPDLRGHGSQPLTVKYALRHLDELGPIHDDDATAITAYLTSVSHPNGGVPPVTPAARHTEASPHWRTVAAQHPHGALRPTAAIAGLLHKHHTPGPWRDRATAFCWTRIDALHWTDPDEAQAVCTFLEHAPNRARAEAALDRLTPMIRAVIETDPQRPGTVRRPLDIAPHPRSLARRMFTDAEIDGNLDLLETTQLPDGGWDTAREHWTELATREWRGMATIRRRLTHQAYGRLTPGAPDRNTGP
ncbi:prenyltransferase [Nocardiopsis suaedae]|uniref:Prenyltransferase n=1 Tax=Nocardiopsis suaedae TaxID=3018444 RepID=A0ABT4TX49_9ACTN|nr:prenyltransferase [Nocardiopsis suaedae]MDA2809001.1 prenyltransferase [Nocardiopsis suaedae]